MLLGAVYNKLKYRNRLEGISCCIRMECLQRDLPAEFSLLNTIYLRLILWFKKIVWQAAFELVTSQLYSLGIFMFG
ncbi:transposase [Avibacterium paragallinarum]|uniref:Uncharacterized protein n=1 Tax=Avibacterium paragallinarum TaxID=728 RepID=A0A8B3T716_AVIPA|nr:transposase [Avibacterium paragallinarum]RZN57142.1 hypothetical protein EIG79_09465 [Avibacterium paragallinarum]RZN59946.1 hypothetical protein EIG78_00350 [Avibacterium paragallinarum]RZN69315.1 hypothetical protein EIG77_10205 [Avibacterium paragallinarum]